MLSCKEITENANEYLEKDLPFFVRLKFKMHLKMCINCQRYVDQLQMTIQILGQMKKAETADDATVDNIVSVLKENDGKSDS